MPGKFALAALAGAALLAASAAALAQDRDGDDGWAPPERGCHCDCGCERPEEVRLPASFFYDYGGVGPAFFDFGPSGGTEAIEFTQSRISASASANASASARAAATARVSARISIRAHGGMMHMHMGGRHY